MTADAGVSVVIPTTGGELLRRAVESALSQVGVQVEVVVVMNGTSEVPEFKDERVRVLRSPSEGRGNGARQLGIEQARHSVVAMLDDDDYWTPVKLSRQVGLLHELEARHGGCWIISCQLQEENEQGSAPPRPASVPAVLDDPARYLFSRPHLRSRSPQLQTSTLLFRQEFGRRVGFEACVRYHQDWTWAIRAGLAGARFAFVPEPLVRRALSSPTSVGKSITWQESLRWGRHQLGDADGRTRGDFFLVVPAYKAARSGSLRGVAASIIEGLHRGSPGLSALLFALVMLLRAAGNWRPERSVREDQVFVRATGQQENLGDSLLRRPYLDVLRDVGRLHVLVRKLSDDYVTGLGLLPSDCVYRSERVWLRSALRSSVRTRTHFAFNAGEVRVSRYYAQQYLTYLPVVVATKLRGGWSFQVGTGIRPGESRWRHAMRLVLAFVDVVTWRDPISREVMRVGRVAPDWAFVEGAAADALGPTASERRSIVISMRGDRAIPAAAWYEGIQEYARTRSLRPMVVVQVERDRHLAHQIAEQLGGGLIDWSGGPHDEHEARLREIYRDAQVVISDRLHVLVMALTEGAVPIGLARDVGKIARHFATLDMTYVAQPGWQDAADVLVAIETVVQNASDMPSRLELAREDLRRLAKEMRAARGARGARHG